MRIAIVGDTHMPAKAKALPSVLAAALEGMDRILHVGDWTQRDVVAMLESYAPVDSVAGNNDEPDIIARYGYRRILQLEGVRIGMIHGDAGKGKSTPERAWNSFAHGEVQVILFGHSHQPYDELREGVALFNPGSPTDKRREPLYSFGVMELHAGSWKLEHIKYADKSPN